MNENVAQLLLLQDTMDAIRQRVVDAVLFEGEFKRMLNGVGFDSRNEDHRLVLTQIEEHNVLVDVVKYDQYIDTLKLWWTPAMISAINGQVNRESPKEIWTQEDI